MQHATIVKTGLLIGCLLGGWALAQQTTALPTITLDQSVHFLAPDETDVEAQACMYQVESAGEMRLRLSPHGGGMPLLMRYVCFRPRETEATITRVLNLSFI